MNNEPDFARLLRNSLVATLCGATLILLSYFLVDRQVAFFVHRHQLSDSAILKFLTYPPPILQAWAPVALAGLMVRRVLGPFHRWECAMIAACLGIIVADQFRDTLGFAFGRYWPETWIDDNPSLIGDGAYGFHPFHGGAAYRSFPSGHAARILAVATIVWIGYPRWRWACVLSSLAVAAGLIGMNYHFVGDVIAGGFVGGIVGAYIAIPAFNCMDGTRRATKTSK